MAHPSKVSVFQKERVSGREHISSNTFIKFLNTFTLSIANELFSQDFFKRLVQYIGRVPSNITRVQSVGGSNIKGF